MLYSIDEFASACKMPRKSLMVYVGRKKVIVLENQKIDGEDDKNKAFLQKHKDKKPIAETITTTQKKEVKIKPNPNDEEINLEDILSNAGQSYSESERQLKYLDTLKRRKEIEKLEIEISKKKGIVIPTELVQPVVLQHNQSIITEFKNTIDEIIRSFAKRRDLTVNDVAEVKGECISSINLGINKATLITVKAIETIVNDFSEKKGVGERNA